MDAQEGEHSQAHATDLTRRGNRRYDLRRRDDQGSLPGEIVELEAPHKLVYHWWDKSKAGKLRSEGWPSYALQPSGENATLVRHHAKMKTYGVYRLAAPIFRRFAVRERTVTIDALKASFESSQSSAQG